MRNIQRSTAITHCIDLNDLNLRGFLSVSKLLLPLFLGAIASVQLVIAEETETTVTTLTPEQVENYRFEEEKSEVEVKT